MKLGRFNFWQEFPSIHQAPLLEALGSSDVNVRLLVSNAISSDRKALGWQEPEFKHIEVCRVSDTDDVERLIHADKASDPEVHIVSGLHSYPLPSAALKALLRENSSSDVVGLYTEPLRPLGARGFLRLRRLTRQTRLVRDHIDFVLATGHLAVHQYSTRGLRNVAPFAYFTEAESRIPKAVWPRHQGTFVVGFVGQLVRRKRVDLLLRGFAAARITGARLEIIGAGPEEAALQSLAAALDISDQVAWRGAVPSHEVAAALSEMDVLVLPSDFDGWGAVVNEALTVGTPVIGSSGVGATSLLRTPDKGSVFKRGDFEGLARRLAESASSPRTSQSREELIHWARRSIHPRAGAAYLRAIVSAAAERTMLPVPPWQEL